MYLNDRQITERCLDSESPMISPFIAHQVKSNPQGKVISYGLSSRGYDARLDSVFLIPRFELDASIFVADPKNTHVNDYEQKNCDKIVIPPNRFVLGQTKEYFRIPRNICGICWNKSTYARCGLIVNVTPLEPEWCGHLTIELSNTHEKPIVVYANEGICQISFDYNPDGCETSYADRKGKYQNQLIPTVAKI